MKVNKGGCKKAEFRTQGNTFIWETGRKIEPDKEEQ